GLVLAIQVRTHVEIDQIDLVDFQIVALEGISGEVGGDADRQHDQGKSDPGPFQFVKDVLEDEIIERADDQDIEDDEQGDIAEGHDIDIEIIKLLLEPAGDVGT